MSVSASVIRLLRGDPYRDPWKRHEYARVVSFLQPALREAGDLADFGCGEGLMTTLLAESAVGITRVIGVDETPHQSWHEHPRVQFRVGDAAALPLGYGAVDVVVAKDLLHHMDDPAEGIRTLIRTARQRVVIIEANLDNPMMALYTKFNGDRHLRRSAFERLVRDSACEGVEWEFATLVAYPFYPPPVRGISALWVWPVTAAMLVIFKVARSKSLAGWLDRAARRLPWDPPFSVAIGEVPSARNRPHVSGATA